MTCHGQIARKKAPRSDASFLKGLSSYMSRRIKKTRATVRIPQMAGMSLSFTIPVPKRDMEMTLR